MQGKVFDKYKTVVVMSGTYASQMPLVNFLKKNWNFLKKKKVVAVAVGMIDPKDAASKVSYNLIPKEIRDEIKYFKLPGKFLGAKGWGKVEEESLKKVLKWVGR